MSRGQAYQVNINYLNTYNKIHANLKIFKKGLNFYRKFIIKLSLLLSKNIPSQSKHSLNILKTRNFSEVFKSLKHVFKESQLKGFNTLCEFETLFILKNKQIEDYIYLTKKYNVEKMNMRRNLHNRRHNRGMGGRNNNLYTDIYDYQSRSLDYILKKIQSKRSYMPIRVNLHRNKMRNNARESGKEFRRQLADYKKSVTDFDVTIADSLPILKEYSNIAKSVYGQNLCKSLGIKKGN